MLVGTLVFLGMVAAGFSYVIALVGDYAAGIVFSYFMNKTFTFRVKVQSDVKPLLMTALTYIATFSLNVLLLSVAIEIYQFNIVYAQVVIMLLLAIMNYLMFKFLIFRIFASGKGRDETSVQEG